jgi:6-phosphogluconolactonase
VISVFLTGGRSAKSLYRESRSIRSMVGDCKHCNFFLTDERCVPAGDVASNYSMIIGSLFCNEPVKNFSRMEGESNDLIDASDRYGSLIPDVADVILLSMGEDGHIASLFPNSPALIETQRKVVPVVGLKAPHRRLTITPPVIKAAKQVYVLAIGDEKRRKYEEALLDPEDISSIPARLVLDRTWIFDLDEEIDLCPKL